MTNFFSHGPRLYGNWRPLAFPPLGHPSDNSEQPLCLLSRCPNRGTFSLHGRLSLRALDVAASKFFALSAGLTFLSDLPGLGFLREYPVISFALRLAYSALYAGITYLSRWIRLSGVLCSDKKRADNPGHDCYQLCVFFLLANAVLKFFQSLVSVYAYVDDLYPGRTSSVCVSGSIAKWALVLPVCALNVSVSFQNSRYRFEHETPIDLGFDLKGMLNIPGKGFCYFFYNVLPRCWSLLNAVFYLMFLNTALWNAAGEIKRAWPSHPCDVNFHLKHHQVVTGDAWVLYGFCLLITLPSYWLVVIASTIPKTAQASTAHDVARAGQPVSLFQAPVSIKFILLLEFFSSLLESVGIFFVGAPLDLHSWQVGLALSVLVVVSSAVNVKQYVWPSCLLPIVKYLNHRAVDANDGDDVVIDRLSKRLLTVPGGA